MHKQGFVGCTFLHIRNVLWFCIRVLKCNTWCPSLFVLFCLQRRSIRSTRRPTLAWVAPWAGRSCGGSERSRPAPKPWTADAASWCLWSADDSPLSLLSLLLLPLSPLLLIRTRAHWTSSPNTNSNHFNIAVLALAPPLPGLPGFA